MVQGVLNGHYKVVQGLLLWARGVAQRLLLKVGVAQGLLRWGRCRGYCCGWYRDYYCGWYRGYYCGWYRGYYCGGGEGEEKLVLEELQDALP